MARRLSISPDLVAQMPTPQQLARELAEDLKHEPKEPDSLGNVAKRMSPMYPYVIPKSKLKYTTLADVVNNKPFKGFYPESFGNVSDYFLNSGISPYYEVVDDLDYAPGVFTISTMIELTCSGRKWALARDEDIDYVILIAEQYQESLMSTIVPTDNSPDMTRRKNYAAKLSKFLNAMYKARKRYEHRTGKVSTSKGLQDLLRELFE